MQKTIKIGYVVLHVLPLLHIMQGLSCLFLLPPTLLQSELQANSSVTAVVEYIALREGLYEIRPIQLLETVTGSRYTASLSTSVYALNCAPPPICHPALPIQETSKSSFYSSTGSLSLQRDRLRNTTTDKAGML